MCCVHPRHANMPELFPISSPASADNAMNIVRPITPAIYYRRKLIRLKRFKIHFESDLTMIAVRVFSAYKRD